MLRCHPVDSDDEDLPLTDSHSRGVSYANMTSSSVIFTTEEHEQLFLALEGRHRHRDRIWPVTDDEIFNYFEYVLILPKIVDGCVSMTLDLRKTFTNSYRPASFISTETGETSRQIAKADFTVSDATRRNPHVRGKTDVGGSSDPDGNTTTRAVRIQLTEVLPHPNIYWIIYVPIRNFVSQISCIRFCRQ